MAWMTNNKLRLGSLHLYTEQCPEVITNLLVECNTTDLQKIGLSKLAKGRKTSLHLAIAEQCPNLQELFIPMARASIHSGNPIFSIKTLRFLHLQLNSGDSKIPLSAMEGLRDLRLSGGKGHDVSFESESLQTVHACDLDERTWVRCRCPNLQSFSCAWYNGAVPSENLSYPEDYDETTLDGSGIITAGRCEFLGLAVPDSCRITIAHA